MATLADKFIQLGNILNSPGNPVVQRWVSGKAIREFGYPPDEYTKLGAGGNVTMWTGELLYAKETPQDILDAMGKIKDEE